MPESLNIARREMISCAVIKCQILPSEVKAHTPLDGQTVALSHIEEIPLHTPTALAAAVDVDNIFPTPFHTLPHPCLLHHNSLSVPAILPAYPFLLLHSLA